MMNAGEVATKLNIAKDTLRAYSLELEKAGYEFKRNNRNQRDYSDYDLSILNAFLTLSKTYGLTLKEAASKVSSSDFKPSKRYQG
ncbi:MerR family transcriptional regulator [Rummeliibacillus sp. TYF005]|nr:MerR family transcriptional regulator [Rummeliibacillus sp. TYF005]